MQWHDLTQAIHAQQPYNVAEIKRKSATRSRPKFVHHDAER